MLRFDASRKREKMKILSHAAEDCNRATMKIASLIRILYGENIHKKEVNKMRQGQFKRLRCQKLLCFDALAHDRSYVGLKSKNTI